MKELNRLLLKVIDEDADSFKFRPYKNNSSELDNKIYHINKNDLFSFIDSTLYSRAIEFKGFKEYSLNFVNDIIDVGASDNHLWDGLENLVFRLNIKKNKIKIYMCSIAWDDGKVRGISSLDTGRLVYMLHDLKSRVSLIEGFEGEILETENCVVDRKKYSKTKLENLDLSGKLISFEGGEGSGKTTQIKHLVWDLEKNGYEVLSLREPGGSKISEEIRNVILDKENIDMNARCETLCFAASRAQLMKEKILPALSEGKVVILDRFVDTSYVYQGLCKSVGLDLVESINKFATYDKMPDLTIYVKVSPEVGMERIHSNNRETNKYEMVDMDFHKLVSENYAFIANQFKDRITTIDGEMDENSVYKSIIKVLKDRFKPKD